MDTDWKRVSLDYQPDPADYFQYFFNEPWPCLLDSAGSSGQGARYDMLSANPFKTLVTHDRVTKVQSATSEYQSDLNPFEILKNELRLHQNLCPAHFRGPFKGGAVGFLSYDLGHFADTAPQHSSINPEMPLMALGFYDWAIILDHQEKSAHLVGSQKSIQYAIERLKMAPDKHSVFKLDKSFQSNMDFSDYKKKFKVIQEQIHNGDCYQVNFAQRFYSSYSGHPWHAFRSLKKQLKAPYSAYLASPFCQVLSFSPELFLDSDSKGYFTTRPIKGTRPRAHLPEKDILLKNELIGSQKDRAENLMIVDLLRNDLSKSCKPNTVKTTKLFEIESYPTVHHLVSEICGERKEGIDSIELLKACFPGGSITGTPKLTAMDVISQLEPNSRSVFTGTIGYFGFQGDLRTNIAIRTLVCYQNEIYCWAGGGIVADSEVNSEYQECFDKVKKILSLLETI